MKYALPLLAILLLILLGSLPDDGQPGTRTCGMRPGLACAAEPSRAAERAALPASGWRGVFFNPVVAGTTNVPWLLHYDAHRAAVRQALAELRDEAGINLVDVQILIPHSLKSPARGNQVGERVEQWANVTFLDNIAQFVDDCHAARIGVELDLADNRWLPPTVDPDGHIGKPGDAWWPQPDTTPWDESAEWYAAVIQHVETRASHPEAIAMWCMMGNYQCGGAEPVLWDNSAQPEISQCTERFVKEAWPTFRSAGKRPKAAPLLLPIFAAAGYWQTKTPADRLSGFTNLKRWIVDDLKQPPDYWVMSTYGHCDPAPDGIHYLREIVEILGPADAGRILSTDFKGAGHEEELRGTILAGQGGTGPEVLRWHLAKCREYGFAGWWMWAYQDTATSKTGLRRLDGGWKAELVREIVNDRDR